MSTIDTSTWNPDPALNESIGDIPLNESASIQQTWQAIQMLMAAGGLHGLQLVTFEGATASADGKQGLVPAPEAGDQDKVLKGNGTWDTLSVSDIPNIDASKIISGTIDIARLPAGALERLVTVADQTARYALTTTSVQLGDTVKQLDTGAMYIVVDTSKLGQAAGYVEYTAGSATSVPWTGVTGKPSTFTPSSHTHSGTEVALTGYSKPSATSAIAASDTVNAAVGKLEKDNDYLHDEFLLVKGVADNAYAVGTANTLLIQDLQDALDTMLKTKIYPVGSTYFSLTDSRNPNVILGFGTWAKIEGRFLLGASSSYAADSTGGEATHTLTENEMPEHCHDSLRFKTPDAKKFGCNANGSLTDTSWTISYTSGRAKDYYVTGNTGGSQAHNNMPPYLAGHLWRRTA